MCESESVHANTEKLVSDTCAQIALYLSSVISKINCRSCVPPSELLVVLCFKRPV